MSWKSTKSIWVWSWWITSNGTQNWTSGKDWWKENDRMSNWKSLLVLKSRKCARRIGVEQSRVHWSASVSKYICKYTLELGFKHTLLYSTISDHSSPSLSTIILQHAIVLSCLHFYFFDLPTPLGLLRHHLRLYRTVVGMSCHHHHHPHISLLYRSKRNERKKKGKAFNENNSWKVYTVCMYTYI